MAFCIMDLVEVMVFLYRHGKMYLFILGGSYMIEGDYASIMVYLEWDETEN